MKKMCFGILLLLLIMSCEKKENPLVGQNAFDFALMNVEGQLQKLNDFKGQNIMLHFWADWCASCREEFYTLQNVYDSIKDNNATVIGVNVGQEKEHVKELIDEYDVTFTMLRDENKEITEKYHVVGLPMNYFITKSGKIHKVITGWMDKDKILEILQEIDR
jgi:peroxiredoxin